MFRTPASICLRGPNDLFVPGLIAGTLVGLALLDCAAEEQIMASSADAIVITAVARKHRRSWLISSTIFLPRINSFRRNAFICHSRRAIIAGHPLEPVESVIS